MLDPRRLLLLAVSGFTLASVLCGIATGLPKMVLFRVLQGVFGAALAPAYLDDFRLLMWLTILAMPLVFCLLARNAAPASAADAPH